MKKVFLLLIQLCVTHFTFGQTTKWTWETESLNGMNSITRGVVLDNSGNTFAAGEITGFADYGLTNVLVSNGGSDAWVMKMDANKNALWGFTDGGTLNDEALAIAIDPNQQFLYVTGRYMGSATFTGTGGTPVTLTAVGGEDIFLAKYNCANGNIVWAKSAGGPARDEGYGVAVKSNGEIIICGKVESATNIISFGLINISSPSQHNMYLARCSSSGNWLNVLAGGTGPNIGYSSAGLALTIDASNNIYVTGSASSGCAWGTITPPGTVSLYVAKANSNASAWTWVKTANSGGGNGITNIGSNIYLTGSFTGSITVGSTNLNAANNTSDILVASISNSGTWNWAKKAGTTLNDFGNAIIPFGSELLITGSFSEGLNSGVNCSFGTISITSLNNRDVFFAKLTTTGTFTCAIAGNGENEDNSYCISAKGANAIIGGFSHSHDYTIGNTSEGTQNNATNALLTRFEGVSLSPTTAKVCAGSPVILTASGGGSTYHWISSPASSLPTGNPITVAPTVTTQYTVTANTNFGCSSTAISVITVNPLPVANAGPNQTICCGPVQIGTTNNSAYSYMWTPPNGLSSTTISDPFLSSAGTYTVTVTNNATQCASSDVMVANYGPSCCARLSNIEQQIVPNVFVDKDQLLTVELINDFVKIETITIHDISGKLLFSKQYSENNIKESLEKMPSGILIVTVTNSDQIQFIAKLPNIK